MRRSRATTSSSPTTRSTTPSIWPIGPLSSFSPATPTGDSGVSSARESTVRVRGSFRPSPPAWWTTGWSSPGDWPTTAGFRG
jgi:hypothetical protein